jgi:hypothetical protein
MAGTILSMMCNVQDSQIPGLDLQPHRKWDENSVTGDMARLTIAASWKPLTRIPIRNAIAMCNKALCDVRQNGGREMGWKADERAGSCDV